MLVDTRTALETCTPVEHLQAIVVDIEAEEDLPYETDISPF